MNVRRFFKTIGIACCVNFAILAGILLALHHAPQVGDVMPGGDPIESNRVNVLFFGKDKVASLTDTIILASLNTDNGDISTISIPRDTRVLIEGRYRKINEAYGVGVSLHKQGKTETDEEILIRAVREVTGLPIHHYLKLDTSSFREVIDILGGVEVEVPQPGMYYNDPLQNLSINIPPGRQVLDGKNAEGFVRFRAGYANGDLGRVSAQQYFIKCLIEQKVNLRYLGKIDDIAKTLTEAVDTSLSVTQITKYAMLAPKVSSDRIYMFVLPGTAQTIGGVSYVLRSEREIQEMANIREVYFSDDPVETLLTE